MARIQPEGQRGNFERVAAGPARASDNVPTSEVWEQWSSRLDTFWSKLGQEQNEARERDETANLQVFHCRPANVTGCQTHTTNSPTVLRPYECRTWSKLCYKD